MAAIIDAWAAVWLLVASAVAIAGLRRARRLPTAAWLVSIGGFLAVQEDPLLIIQMASSKPRSGLRGGMLGLVTRTPGHTRTACLPGPRRGGCCSGHRPVRAAPQRGVGMVGARRILAAGNGHRHLRGVLAVSAWLSVGPHSRRRGPGLRSAHAGSMDRDLGGGSGGFRGSRTGQIATSSAGGSPRHVLETLRIREATSSVIRTGDLAGARSACCRGLRARRL
jgi:hypothetical protein